MLVKFKKSVVFVAVCLLTIWISGSLQGSFAAVNDSVNPVFSTIRGDVNEDGLVDIRDMVRLKRILAEDQGDRPAGADANQDGTLSAQDAVALRIVLLYEGMEMPVYTVVFRDEDGTVFKTEQVPKGASAVAPEMPGQAGKTWNWDRDFGNIMGDTVITAYCESAGQTPAEKPATLQEEAERILYLGKDLLANRPAVVLGNGWTGDYEAGFSYSGGSGVLEFDIASEAGKLYYITFDIQNHGKVAAQPSVAVQLGNSYEVDVYNGTTCPAAVIKSREGGKLRLIPFASFKVGTITRLSCKEIADGKTDDQKKITLLNFSTAENLQNMYGFWNVVANDHGLQSENTSRTVAIGHNALLSLIGGNRNIAIGTFSLSQMLTGESNIGLGADAMLAVQKGARNVAIGHGALYNGGYLQGNIAIGHGALYGSAAGNPVESIGIGEQAGYYNTGSGNTFIGAKAGYRNTTGYQNTAIGANAHITGQTNARVTLIGSGTKAREGVKNATAIGFLAETTKDNQVVLGNDEVTETLLKGELIIKATDGTYKQIVFREDGSVGWVTVE